MSLDPDAERVLDLIKAAGRPPIQICSPDEARTVYRASRKALSPDPPSVAQVQELNAPGPAGGIPLRFYRGIETPEHTAPALVFIHGGGFCIGDRDTHDVICRKLANETKSVVISVEYRLAPEHKFPAAVEDCAAAIAWVSRNADALWINPTRLAVGGDSAGGNLSAVLAHMARDGDLPPLCFQLLLYPSVEMSMRHPSYMQDFSRFPLTGEAVQYFHAHYLRDEKDQVDWRASPLRAPRFRGLAPAFVLTAGYDPLRDEGAEYARVLEANDVPVTFVHMSDQMHGFLTMGCLIRAADTALELAATVLRSAFSRIETSRGCAGF
jgi:acetyl esterase